MIRAVFTIFIIFHGLIHLLGFMKAIRPDSIKDLTMRISKPAGIIWLSAAVLFLAAAASIFFLKGWWWMIAAPAAAVSQVLVILYWRDAKFGTVVNVAILVAAVIGLGTWRFDAMVKNERASLLAAVPSTGVILTEKMTAQLPLPIQTWLARSRLVGRETIASLRLIQKGEMRTSPDGTWMPVEAEQWVSTGAPGFIWKARVTAAPGIHLAGRDLYYNGRGHMLIKLLSLFPVVNARGGEIDQGSMLRFLGEMACYPSAALNDYVRWEALGPSAARAVMTYGGITASGVFRFDERGDLASFEARRYYGEIGAGSLEDWLVTIDPKG
ncbi:MAG: hypothetical protein E4G96_09810, partial [Chrysiogenales bacterium]